MALTWMEAEAGDLGALQSLSQLMGEEDVTQLAVTVGLSNSQERGPQPQSLVGVQTVKVNFAKVMSNRRQIDHPTWPALLQPLQQQVG